MIMEFSGMFGGMHRHADRWTESVGSLLTSLKYINTFTPCSALWFPISWLYIFLNINTYLARISAPVLLILSIFYLHFFVSFNFRPCKQFRQLPLCCQVFCCLLLESSNGFSRSPEWHVQERGKRHFLIRVSAFKKTQPYEQVKTVDSGKMIYNDCWITIWI